MKLSKTAIKELTARYRSVLQKCIVLNMAAFTLLTTATPARADLTISNGTVDWQDFYYLNHNNLNITGGIVSNSGIVGFDRVNTANTYHPVMTNNYFETKTDLSQINFEGGTFADTIARAHGTGSDLTVSGGAYAGRLLLSAADALTITGGTFGTAETPLTALELRAHAITTPRSVLATGASNYAIAAATGTLTLTFGEDEPWAISKTVLSAPGITTGTLTASGNTHIGFTPVIEKYTYTPEEAEPVSVFSFKNTKPLTDVTVQDSAITLKDSSKIGIGFIGTEIPIEENIVETGTGAAFVGGAQIAAAETDRDNLVQKIKDAIDAVVEMIDPNSGLPLAPEARYVHLPAVVRDVLDIEYGRDFIDTTSPEDGVADTWTSTSLTDRIRDLLATGDADDITAAKGLVEATIGAVYTNYVHNGVDGINAVLTTMKNAPGVTAADRYDLLPDDVKDVLANTTYVAEHSNTLAEFVDWAYANDPDAITGAVSAALNDVNLTIKDTTVNMKDTSSIVNASDKVNPTNGNIIFTTDAGATAVNVTGGTGEEEYNTIAAHNNIFFNAGSTLTVGSAEEDAAGSKLNMTATNGNIEFDEAGTVTVNAGSTVNMQANNGVIYSESGALTIGSATENAATATVKIRTTDPLDLTNDPAAIDGFGLDLDYTEFWTLHSAEIGSVGTPGYNNAALREGDSNYHPAYTVLGMTPGAPAIAANTLTIADSTLTANNAVIDGNLFFHNAEGDHATGAKTVTQTLANSIVKGNVSIANEAPAQIAATDTAFTLEATTAAIEGNVKAYTGNYTAEINELDHDTDTLVRSGSVTTLNLRTVGGTVTTAGTAESTTNVYVKTQTGSPADTSVEPPVDAVDGSIAMTGGTLSLTIGEDAADAEDATVYGNVTMTGAAANLTISEVATVTGNVTVSDATPATLALNGTIGGNAIFTGDVLISDAKASKGTVTGALTLADDKTFDMQNGSYSTAYAGKYDNLTAGKINAGAAANPTVLKLDVDTGAVSNTKNIDHFTLTGSDSSGKMVISSLRNEKYDNVDELYTFDELWGLREFSMDVVGLGEGASSEGLTVTLDDALTAERSAAVSGGSLTNDEIKEDNASWHRVLTETLAHASNFSTEIDWTLDHFSTYDKVTTKTTNLTLSEGCGSGQAGACTLTFTKTAEESIENEYVIGNTMVALNQQVGGVRSMQDVEANDGHRFTVTEHLNTTGRGTFMITGMIDEEHPETVVSVIDMNSMNGFTVGADAILALDHVSFDNIQGAAGAGTDGKVLTISVGGTANLDTVILAGDDLSAEKKSLIINNGTLIAENSKIMLDNRAGSDALIYGTTTLFSTTNAAEDGPAAAAQLTFYGAEVVADEITNNGEMFLADDDTDPENIIGAELTTNLSGTGTVEIDEHSVLTLAETGAPKTNNNAISGAGMTVIDNADLTTEEAIATNITINAGKQLTAGASLLGEAGKTITNDGMLVLKNGTLVSAVTLGENGDITVDDDDVRSNVALGKATINANKQLTIAANHVGTFDNSLGGRVVLTGGELSKVLGGNVTLAGATSLAAGGNFTGADIDLNTQTLTIGTNAMTANTLTNGTIALTLTENAGENTLITTTGGDDAATNITLSVDNQYVSRLDVQHYLLTTTTTGYTLNLTGAGRYAIDTQLFTLEEALTMEAFDPATWHGGDLYMLKLATVAEVAAEKQTESGIVVSQNEQIAVQALSDESRAALTAGQQAQFDQINTRLANAVDAGNREEIRQILREVGAEKAPAVAQTEIANVGAVMNVVGTRLGGGAPAPAAAASGDHGRSGGDEIIAGKASVWGQYMLNTAKLTGQNGFDSDSNGFAFGFEYKINDEYKAGIGYARSSTDITTNRSKTDVDTHTGFLYGEYKPGNFYVNGVLSYGKSSYDEKTKLTGITADYDANTLGVQALTGYSFGNWTPEGGLRYTNVRQKAYTNSLGVRFANKTNDTLTGIVGLRYAKTFKAGSGLLITPEGKLALTYDLNRSNQGRSVTLANGTGYVAEGKNLDRTGLELGAGVSFKVNDSLDIGLSYEGKFRKDYSDHTGLFNVKYNF